MCVHRVIQRFFGSSIRHDEAVLLLPWYANGSLKSPEQRRVHQHVCRCEACRAELARLEVLRHSLRNMPVPVIRRAALDSLMASIERLEQEQAEVCADHVRASARPVQEPRFGWISFAWLPHAPMAAAAGLFLAIALLGWNGVAMRSADYRTLGSREAVVSGSDRNLHVVFEPGSDPGRIDALVNSVRGQIVDGPSELGVYTIRIDGDASAVTQAAARLRMNPQVAFAEPAAPPLP
ncbi:anti-sigma factor [Methylotetracoccus oryzae]|uniref:anti-sigma factor n=1 Tax=Methylotetracoccus oryzae TaxID=1919059 RepID=UPI00111875AA|nr:zf-HC2 domain-containing protein [Methylotetracoccus oryzae]